MKIGYAIGCGVTAIYSFVLFVLLLIYSKQELEENKFIIDATSKPPKTMHTGDSVITANTVHLVGMLFLTRLLYYWSKGGHATNFSGRMTVGVVICEAFSAIWGIVEYGLNCTDGNPKCHQWVTPLYIMTLIHIYLLFAFVGIMIITLLLFGLYYLCKSDEIVEEYQLTESNENVPGALTYETIINLRSLEGTDKCAICLDDFVVKDSMKIGKCGHYFHFKCLKKWGEQKSNCPVCKAKLEI